MSDRKRRESWGSLPAAPRADNSRSERTFNPTTDHTISIATGNIGCGSSPTIAGLFQQAHR
eukprot:6266318-Prymnesium_polylepis.3